MKGFLDHVKACEDAIPTIDAKEELIIALQHIGFVQNLIREKVAPGTSKPQTRKRSRAEIVLVESESDTCSGTYWRTADMLGPLPESGKNTAGQIRPKKYAKAFLKTSQCQRGISKEKPKRGPPCASDPAGKLICKKCYSRMQLDQNENLL